MSLLSGEDIFRVVESMSANNSCDDSQIDAVQRDLGVVFPPVFRRIHRAAGRAFPANSHLFPLRTLVKQRAEWLECAAETPNPVRIPKAAVFFDETPECQAYFFVSDGCDDPEVFAYNYYLDRTEPDRQDMRLSVFLAMRLRESLNV